MTRKKKKRKKRESIMFQLKYASQKKIKERNRIPNPQKMAGRIARLIASHHEVSIQTVNEDMAIAWLRHRHTNYDLAIADTKNVDTKRINSGGSVVFDAVSDLKDKANDTAREIYHKVFPQGIENFVKPKIVVIR